MFTVVSIHQRKGHGGAHLDAGLVARQVVVVHLPKAAVQVPARQVQRAQPQRLGALEEEVVDQAVVCARHMRHMLVVSVRPSLAATSSQSPAGHTQSLQNMGCMRTKGQT